MEEAYIFKVTNCHSQMEEILASHIQNHSDVKSEPSSRLADCLYTEEN